PVVQNSNNSLKRSRSTTPDLAPSAKVVQTDNYSPMDVDTVPPLVTIPSKASKVTPVKPLNKDKAKAEPMQDIIFNEPNPWIDVVPAHSSSTVDNKRKTKN